MHKIPNELVVELNHNGLKVVVSPMLVSDLEDFIKIRNSCVEYLHCDRVYKVEDAKLWFEKNFNNYLRIVVDGVFAGYLRFNYDDINQSLLIGLDLAIGFRGIGLAKLVYLNVIKTLFAEYDVNRVWLEVLETNYRAIALYKSLGFAFEGAKRSSVRRKDKFVDSLLFGVLKDDPII